MARKDLIQARRGTAAQWTSVNPTLASGEFGFETDTKKLKIGDGSTAWASLIYIGGSATVDWTDIDNVPALVVALGAATAPGSDLFLRWDVGTGTFVFDAPAGIVVSVVAGTGIDVDSTDPANPIVNLDASSIASLALADTSLQPGDIGSSVQAWSADLDAYAGGDTPSAFTLGIVDSVDAAAWRAAIGAGTSTVTPAALTKVDDTNVTLALGGTPATALLQATSLTLGWTGQLSVPRGGTGAATLTGYVKGNGTSAFTASATIPFADITGGPAGANPTASVGLAAVNGVATSYMRSDGAPALDVSIAPTWTGAHIFALVGTNTTASVELANSNPQLMFNETDGGSNAKNWQIDVGGGAYTFRLINDARNAAANIWAISRSANAVTAISFGNATDNPTYTFLGSGVTSLNGRAHIQGGTASTVSDYQITVQSLTAAGYGAGISFTSTLNGGAEKEMARITADGESSWNTTAATQDAGLRFFTTNDGTAAEKVRITSIGQLLGSAGAAATPAFGILGDTNTGWYSDSADTFKIATGGTNVVSITTTQFLSTLPVLVTSAAAVGTPDFSFTGDSNTGVYSVGADVLGLSAGGVKQFEAGATYTSQVTQVRLTGIISPTQLVANTDNWNPTGLATANVIRISISGALNLTGIVAQAGGTEIILQNLSAAAQITIVHDATSTAANRFYCPGGVNFALTLRKACKIWYDATAQRWQLVAG